jgi:hypothetical protein
MPIHPLHPGRRLAGLIGALALAGAASAEPVASDPAPEPGGPTLSWSAFGTLGWAVTDQPWAYQRHLDEHGSFERDSVLGAQLDSQFSPEWSATLQARLAPSDHDDKRWDLQASWAFVAWRPNNDWLVRAGKLRTPLFLRSEQLDVGQTYSEARLPADIYTIAPTSDFTGVHVTRQWEIGEGELSLDAYRGQADLSKRIWVRTGMLPAMPAGAHYREVRSQAQGLVATWSDPDNRVRLGLHQIRTRPSDGNGILVRPVWAQLGPGIGYWKTNAAQPGPAVASTAEIHNDFIVLGGEHIWPGGWRLAGELVRVIQHDTELGMDAWGGYLSVYRTLGRVTPYASVAQLRSTATSRHWQATLDGTSVPGGSALTTSMQISADALQAYDQHTWAIGAAYTTSPTSSVKLEWMRTSSHQSSMYDLPAGAPLVAPRRVDVYTINYNFVF